MADLKHDSRSTTRDFKRTKDAASKWSNGARQSLGYLANTPNLTVMGGSGSNESSESSESGGSSQKSPRQKVRPQKRRKRTDIHDVKIRCYSSSKQNEARKQWHHGANIQQAITEARNCAADATDPNIKAATSSEMCPKSSPGGDDDQFADKVGQGPPLALDAYVRISGRETEKLVRKEYEILDSEGAEIRGRRAREVLRGQSVVVCTATVTVEDDGFELV